MKLIALLVILVSSTLGVFAQEKKEFIGESESRVLKNLSELTAKFRGSYDPTTEVTKANWMVVTDSQERILDNLVECLAVLKSRKGDLDLDAHRKAIETYRESVTTYWVVETKPVIEDKNSTMPLLKKDTFLIRHLAVCLLAELRWFREDSEESTPAISALSETIFSDMNAVLKWLGPAVDKSFGSPTELPRHLIGEAVPPNEP